MEERVVGVYALVVRVEELAEDDRIGEIGVWRIRGYEILKCMSVRVVVG